MIITQLSEAYFKLFCEEFVYKILIQIPLFFRIQEQCIKKL